MEQERQKRDIEIEEVVSQTPNGPILCANNCGFFGSASTNNFCSKCYRDVFLKPAMAASASASASAVVKNDVVEPVVVEAKPPSPSPSVATTSESPPPPEKPPANRCNFCKKRVGLTGFKCRCGDTFCNVHRYSDKHDCSFDYKAAGQDAIAKANPVVKAEKIEKI